MEKSNKEETRFLLKTTDELLTMLTKRRNLISVMSNLRMCQTLQANREQCRSVSNGFVPTCLF